VKDTSWRSSGRIWDFGSRAVSERACQKLAANRLPYRAPPYTLNMVFGHGDVFGTPL